MRNARPSPARLGRLAIALAVVLAAGRAHALHRESQPATRLSFGSGNVIPETHSWGNNFAFASSTDLLGNGSTGQHMFVFNMAYFDCDNHTTKARTPCPNPPLPPLVQLEHRPGSPSNPSVTGDGTWVAFEADGSFNGNTGGAAHHRQVFMMSIVTGEVLQVTRSNEYDSIRPSLNKPGTVVVFESKAPLGGRNDLAGISQIFAYDRLTKHFAQLSFGRAPSIRALPNAAANRVSFESTADLLGDNHDTGISQIFVGSIDVTGAFTATLTQITNGNRPSKNAYIAEKGVDLVVFESTATDLAGSDGDGTSQIFGAPTGGGNFPPLSIFTNRAQFGDCNRPVLDITGSHLAFVCTGDPLENGTTGNRMFAIDMSADPSNPATPQLYQLTGRGDPQGLLRHNVGQWFLTFVDRVDRTGSGACDYQLQILDYYPGHWNAATKKGALPPDLLPPDNFPSVESNQIGARAYPFLPGDAFDGSRLTVSSRNAPVQTGTIGRGQLGLSVLPLSVDGVASVAVGSLTTLSSIPPINVTGLGTICLALTEDGTGTLACNGGQPGGDLITEQDHDVGDVNPGCVGGCFERGSCQGPLPGPHKGTCNGDIDFKHTGTYAPGGMTLRLSLAVGVASDPGADGIWCDDDDSYVFRDYPSYVELTTGTNTATIFDADDALGTTLSTTDSGSPLDCTRLRNQDLTGAQLVGALPILDIPSPTGVRDVLLRLRFDARPPLETPTVCRAAACTTDDDCNDSNVCNGTETCIDRVCAPGTPVVCDDGNACNGVESCDPRTGECLDGRALDCSDGNQCTDEVCNPASGCVHTNNSGPCDDDDACTQGDTCRDGTCVGTPFVQCNDGNPCNGVETCDPESGECINGSALNCNDGNPCTTDSCSPSLGCVHTNNTLPCNDNSKCTANDVCSNGTCGGTPTVQCDDGNACNGTESCNPTTGTCQTGAAPDCDDQNACTADSCDPGHGCIHTPISGPCDDGNACTQGDTCQDGVCKGATSNACDDGDPCNGVEVCNSATGQCVNGPRLSCNDGDPCTNDLCDPANADPATGSVCTHEFITTRRGCDPRQRITKKLKDRRGMVQKVPADDVGGTKWHKRLEKQLSVAQKTFGASAQSSTMKKTSKRLKAFVATLNKIKKRGKLKATTIETLITSANEVMTILGDESL